MSLSKSCIRLTLPLPDGSRCGRSAGMLRTLRPSRGAYKSRIALLTIGATLAVAGTAAASLPTGVAAPGKDPRKCSIDGIHYDKPANCAREDAVIALRRAMSIRTHVQPPPATNPAWDADVTCVGAHHLLLWRCRWTANGGGKATVTFRALSNGWHNKVKIG